MNALNNVKTGVKLTGGFLVVAMILVVVAVLGYINLNSVNDSANTIHDVSFTSLQALDEVQSAELGVHESINAYALQPDQRDRLEKEIADEIAAGDKGLSDLKAVNLSQEEEGALAACEPAWATYKQSVADAIQKFKSADEQAGLESIKYQGPVDAAGDGVDEAVSKVTDLVTAQADKLDKQHDDTFSTATNVSVALGLIGVLLAVGLGLVLTRGITGPLGKLTKAARQIAETDLQSLVAQAGALARGDLNGHLTITAAALNSQSNDELGDLARAFDAMIARLQESGRAFEAMSDNLKQVVADIVAISEKLAAGDLTAAPQAQYSGEFTRVRNALTQALDGLNGTIRQTTLAVTQVAQSVEQVRSVSQDLASGAEETSSAVEEVSSNLEQTDAQVTSSADNAGTANQLVGQTASLAQAGQEKMKALTQAMGAIAQSSQEIGKIIKVIDDIAFQTNLLALNAAVEAARAGQAGRGFAVVAQEVRNLAERSAKAAQSTADLIEQASRRTEDGVKITDETGSSLNAIVQNVVKVKDLVAEMEAASGEQAKMLRQISAAIVQVNQGAQSTGSQSQELASTADELGGLADQLSAESARFHLRESGVNVSSALSHSMSPEPVGAQGEAVQQKKQPPAAKPVKHVHGNGGGKLVPAIDRDERGYGTF